MNIDLIMDSATISQLLEAEDAKMPSSSFNWEGCTYALRSPEGDEWPTLPSRSSLGDVCSRLHIWMDRPPAVSSDSRVRIWYKNCVLPPINVAFNAEGVALDSLSCRLTAVRVDVNEHAAIDEGLQGDTLRPLVQGTCSFTSLLFKTTSYKHKGKPLHLMLTLLSRSGAAGESNVVCNMISPPVIVNARKRQAKEKSPPAMLGSAWTGGDDAKFGSAPTPSPSTLLPFAPGLLERKLEKVEKLSESASRQQIDNSIEGLRAYLSALNIRNKCKHPLFLALRFDSCVRLFYDSHRVCNPLRDDEAFYHMMEVLSSVDPLSTRATGSSNAAELPFVVAVRGDHVSCLRADCPVHGLPVQLTSLFALPHASMLSSTYVELCELQIKHVRSTYCRLYCTHNSRVSTVHPPSQVPQVCNSCDQPHAAKWSPAVHSSHEVAQRQGVALLMSLQQLSSSTQGVKGCPEQEWEHELLVLAEAMSQLCHTRSAPEIIAFMKGDEGDSRATKRMPSATQAFNQPSITSNAHSPLSEKLEDFFTPAHLASFVHEHQHEDIGCPGCRLGLDDLVFDPHEDPVVHDH